MSRALTRLPGFTGVALAAAVLALTGCGTGSGVRGGSGPMMPLDPAEAEFTAIRMLLANYPKLRFDGEQRARLEAIQDTLVTRNRALAERVGEIVRDRRPARPREEGAPRRREPPDERREELAGASEAARPLLEQMRENEEEAIRQALAAFRGPQREVAEKLIAEYRAQASTERR